MSIILFAKQFQDLFATFGGAGSTLSLVIAMLLFCKSKRITNLGNSLLFLVFLELMNQLFLDYQLY